MFVLEGRDVAKKRVDHRLDHEHLAIYIFEYQAIVFCHQRSDVSIDLTQPSRRFEKEPLFD